LAAGDTGGLGKTKRTHLLKERDKTGDAGKVFFQGADTLKNQHWGTPKIGRQKAEMGGAGPQKQITHQGDEAQISVAKGRKANPGR